MTVIAVVRKRGRAVIAADTAASDDSVIIRARYVRNHQKIFRCGDAWLGMAGWSAANDIVESLVRNHGEQLDFSDRVSIFETARRMHPLLKSEYHLETHEEKEQPVESSQLAMLIASPHGIYELDSYRTVTEYERFWALGSGRLLALGAMAAVYDRLDDAEEIARIGVSVACEFDDGCAEPVTLHTLDLVAHH